MINYNEDAIIKLKEDDSQQRPIVPFEFETQVGESQHIGLPFGNNRVLLYAKGGMYVKDNCEYDNRKFRIGHEVSEIELQNGYWYFCTDSDGFRIIDFKWNYRMYDNGMFWAICKDISQVEYPVPVKTVWRHYYTIEEVKDDE